ncbi:signal peptidase I [Paenibacillus aurantius]|uniref:Signal peptidase I n=1 Tax=Paenibacillus aurantius TaxID=2918900 RepID=A0AA96LBC0_9BACL|nr:signal peptidase I [Paenibacillus aurantius]WNQ10551.1 signal peptidase I [Paenibacillus aurantius]
MKWLKEIWGWVGSFAIAFVFAVLIGIFVFQPYKVDGHSMDPTLHDRERVYVSKLPHTFSYVPNYGDIVIIDSRVDRDRTFKDDFMGNPLFLLITGKTDDQVFYVKRLIGKPGDTIEIKSHQVYRNGQLLDEPYIKEAMNAPDGKWTVPAKHIFVMGDNRNNSRDSREIGFIPLDHLMGKKIL